MSPSKSFKDNPALNFISPPAKAHKSPAPKEEAAGSPAPPARPAKAPAASPPPPEPAVPMKPNPLYVETKSKRVQLLMQPSLHRQLKARAEARGQSLNDLVHGVLAEWVERN